MTERNESAPAGLGHREGPGYQQLINMVLAGLDAQAANAVPSEDDVRTMVRQVAVVAIPGWAGAADEEREELCEQATEHILTKVNTSQEIGDAVVLDHVPWLQDAWEDPRGDWTYWETYKRLLLQQSRPWKILRTLEEDVKKTLDLAGDPQQDGHWQRRGLVMGDVQSGKTSNFIGLMNMAADAGYRLFIVIGGHTEDLRSQTQDRVDDGFRGVRSIDTDGRNEGRDQLVGVGHLRERARVISLTTSETDFVANSRRVVDLGDLETTTEKAPIVLVVKKNSKILGNLADWLGKTARGDALSIPMMFIDDESDYASVDTNRKDAEEATAVNRAIRRILERSYKATYVGFTATPFANVLMNPDDDGGIFPKDFIYSLYPPSNYMGAEEYFGDDRDKFARTDVQDAEGVFPLKHKSTCHVPQLPESLKRAIDTFLVACAITDLDVGPKAPRSMLVNVSRFKDVQDQVHTLVEQYVEEMVNVVCNIDPRADMGANVPRALARLRGAWEAEYSSFAHTWAQVKEVLPRALETVESELVNGNTTKQRAEAAEVRARSVSQRGRRYIAVGGTILSRGLTLDGLTVSYFYQRTQLSDTLLQMGRWFGYRDGYEDLVRIWLPLEVLEWFLFTARTLEEIRSDVSLMRKSEMTPDQFGLKIQKHPEALKVTAANKMRHAEQAEVDVAFDRESVETKTAPLDQEQNGRNLGALHALVDACVLQSQDQRLPTTEVSGAFSGHRAYTCVDPLAVDDFIEAFAEAPGDANFASNEREGSFVSSYVRELNSSSEKLWDIVVISGQGSVVSLGNSEEEISVRANRRNKARRVEASTPYLEFANRRLATGGNLFDVVTKMRNGAPERLAQFLQSDGGRQSSGDPRPSETAILHAIERPILMIYPVESLPKEGHGRRDVVTIPASSGALGLKFAFPALRDEDGRIGDKRGGVKYIVNQVWMKSSGLADDSVASALGDDDE